MSSITWRKALAGFGRGLETFGRIQSYREKEDRRRGEIDAEKAERERIRQEDIARRKSEIAESQTIRESEQRRTRIEQRGREIRGRKQRQIELQGADAEKRIAARQKTKAEQAALLRDPKYLYHVWLTNPEDDRVSPAYRKIFEAEYRKSTQGITDEADSGKAGITDKDIFSAWGKLDPAIQEDKYKNNIGVYANEVRRQFQIKETTDDPLDDRGAAVSPSPQAMPMPETAYNQIIGGAYDKPAVADATGFGTSEFPDDENLFDTQGVEEEEEIAPGITLKQTEAGPVIDITDSVETAKEAADPNYLSPIKRMAQEILIKWNSGEILTPEEEAILEAVLLKMGE